MYDAGHTSGGGTVRWDYIQGKPRPKLRGWLHAAGTAVFGPIVSVFLLLSQGFVAIVSLGLFLVGLLATFTVSACYHILAKTPETQTAMQRADHTAIFMLVAGTYSPIVLMSQPESYRWWMLAGVWLIAAVGMVLKATQKAWRLASALYMILGWTVIFTFPALYSIGGMTIVAWLLTGGIFYTAGAVMFWLGFPKRTCKVWGYHEMWHAMTLCGFSCHLVSVVLLAKATGAL